MDHAYQRLAAMRRRASHAPGRLRRAGRHLPGVNRAGHPGAQPASAGWSSSRSAGSRWSSGASTAGLPSHGRRGREEAFHIGRLAISDADQEPLVVDWRAPVAEPFYRATGAHPWAWPAAGTSSPRASGDRPGGRAVRRGGRPSGTRASVCPGPQVLLAALERSRTGRMRDIVATVQREQDEIIRGAAARDPGRPGRPGHRQDGGGPAPGRLPALHPPLPPGDAKACWWSGPTRPSCATSSTCCRRSARAASSCRRSMACLGALGPTGTTSEEMAALKGDPGWPRSSPGPSPIASARCAGPSRSLRAPGAAAHPCVSAQVVATAKRRPGDPQHPAPDRSKNVLWRHLFSQLQRQARTVSEEC